jgi:Plasma-membrane choline transporter
MGNPVVGDRDLTEQLLAGEIEEDDVGEFIVDPLQAGVGLRGETQTAQYRDAPFALAFTGHLVVVLCMAVFWGFPAMFSSEKDRHAVPDHDFHIWGFYFLLILVSTLSIGLASLALDFMINHGESMMQIALMASCLVLGAETVLLFLDGSPALGFLVLFVLICSGLYAYSVQRRIPFAAANLRTALSAIQTNYGVCMVAYAMAAAANLFVVFWILAFAGIAFKDGDYGWSEDGQGQLDFKLNPYLLMFMILSYYWTAQVLQVRR